MYRKLARDYLRHSRETSDPGMKQIHLDMARMCERNAIALEAECKNR